MKNKFIFSVIIPVYNAQDYLKETIESIINQTIGFNNIEIILINDGSKDNSKDVCEKYKQMYPNNIIFIDQENKGVSATRNAGIKVARGLFTNFLDSDDKWSLNSFKVVYDAYKKHKDISIFSARMCFFEARTGEHQLNYKYETDKIIDIKNDYEYIQLSSSSIFVKTDLVKKHEYNSKIKYSEDNRFINEIIIEEERMMMLSKPIYYYRKRKDGTSAIQSTTLNPDWYLVTPKLVYRYLFDLSKEKYGRVIEYFQYLILYDLNWRLIINKNMEFKSGEKEEYIKIVDSLINDISDEIILKHRTLDLAKKMFVLSIKHGNKVYKKLSYTDDYINYDELSMHKKNLGFILIDQTVFKNNKMYVYGKIDTNFVDKNNFKIMINDKEYNYEYYKLTNDYDEETYNNKHLHKYIGFTYNIDINKDFCIYFKSKDTILYPRYKKNAIFTDRLVRSYHNINNRTLYKNKNYLYCTRRTFIKTFYNELRCDLNLIKRKLFKALMIRLSTKILNIFKRKTIWLISDRVNKADDNGEHFYKYLINNNKKDKIYFVLSKKCADYERLSKIGKILDPDSNKYKILFNICDYVVSSQAEDYVVNPLGKGGEYIRDTWHFKYIFLQHGIIVNDLSPWLNINTKRIDMFVTTAKREYNSILDYNYYFKNDVVKLTGIPRFDSLLEKKENTKLENKIMLSFTWRRNLATSIDPKTGEREYNKSFKESDYFKILNDFMNDKRLLKILKEYNYKIRFIPHPNVIPQLKDFKLNEYIEVVSDDLSYQDEFCKNKILITDYSSVSYDFAYLKKPVIYYQNDRKEFFKEQIYEEGYFDYDRDSLGPICTNINDLIDKTIEYIKNDCKCESKYESRINMFYEYHDKKNCERVLKEIKKLK